MKLFYPILISCLFLFQMCSPKATVTTEGGSTPSMMYAADTIEPKTLVKVDFFPEELPPPLIDSLNMPAQWTYDWYASFEQYLAYHVEYPRELRATSEKWDGKVKYTYIIHIDGTVSDIKILESPHELHSKQVINAIAEMPVSWKAAKKDGLTVSSVYEGEIKFHFDF